MNPMLKLLTRRSFAASRTRNLMAVLAIALTALLFTSVATIALGAMLRRTGMLKRESVTAAISEYFSAKPKVIDINIQALDTGIALE